MAVARGNVDVGVGEEKQSSGGSGAVDDLFDIC